jgi:hypothetical protein
VSPENVLQEALINQPYNYFSKELPLYNDLDKELDRIYKRILKAYKFLKRFKEKDVKEMLRYKLKCGYMYIG